MFGEITIIIKMIWLTGSVSKLQLLFDIICKKKFLRKPQSTIRKKYVVEEEINNNQNTINRFQKKIGKNQIILNFLNDQLEH